jgi:hypothetical protein
LRLLIKMALLNCIWLVGDGMDTGAAIVWAKPCERRTFVMALVHTFHLFLISSSLPPHDVHSSPPEG